MSYLAIDFETANEQRASACAVGVVRMDDGTVTDQWQTLINPEADFAAMNIAIHGISEDAVASAPTFPAVLERILAAAEGCEVIVAHNAAFDIQVLTDSAARYGLAFDPQPFACTRVFARRWWPGWPSYGLAHAVMELQLEDSIGWDHHNALWDAQACAAIAERGFAHKGVASWAEAGAAENIHLGVARLSAYAGCVSLQPDAPIRPVRPDDSDLNPDHPLYGRAVCFTGALQLYTRRSAAQAVADVGGVFSTNVTKKTDLLVVGSQDLAKMGEDGTSGKMRKAVEMAAAGHPIEIIDEPDFFRMLAP